MTRAAGLALALLALLATPLRALVDCTMPQRPVASVVAGHEHHGMTAGGAGGSSEAPAPTTPDHGRCPDLAGCALVALPGTADSQPGDAGPVGTPEGAPETRIAAPLRTIDPPPPRR
jgi:hypothetical protein